MRWWAEAVLPGHPDRFCDRVADRIIEVAEGVDDEAFGQVEVSVWGHEVWLTGALITREPIGCDWRQLVVSEGLAVGYVPGSYLDANDYVVRCSIEEEIADPRRFSQRINDQSISVGWAGYDEKTDFLPMEHWLVWELERALWAAIEGGSLYGEGPDGKLLVEVEELGDQWCVRRILVSLQQRPSTDAWVLCEGVVSVLRAAYEGIQRRDGRWVVGFDEVEVLVNPGGAWVLGGSLGDNGQTGRKSVMDAYGPRVPIGGGALHGKHKGHVDCLGFEWARSRALERMKAGEGEVLVRGWFEPDDPCKIRLEGSKISA